jgi:hypothetical protein
MGIRILCAVIVLSLAACGGGGSDGAQPPSGSSSPPPQQQPLPPASAPPLPANEISLLFMGNSHTSYNNLTAMVVDMVRAATPGKTVSRVEAPGFLFLEERYRDPDTLALLRRQSWNFVILQAQKYSTSGLYDYSTDEAKALIRMSREQRAVPILFPEWPRKNIDETRRIYDLHAAIAQAEPACVAPIGQAWDLALSRYPTLPLHSADENHSAPAGAFLAALVLCATITGQSPLGVPPMPQYPVDLGLQETLRGIAAEAVQVVPPRMWCPADVP